jgi:hypothetical protein
MQEILAGVLAPGIPCDQMSDLRAEKLEPQDHGESLDLLPEKQAVIFPAGQ